MLRVSRLAAITMACLLALLAVPASASATPDESSCASLRVFVYTMPLPPEMRTLGVHRIEWLNTFLDEDRNPIEFLDENQIAISEEAPEYSGDVLVRLTRNVGLLPTGEVDRDVLAIRPTQRASFYVATFFQKSTPFADSDRLFVRWEAAPNEWSPWMELDHSQEQSSCSQSLVGLLHRAFGWAG